MKKGEIRRISLKYTHIHGIGMLCYVKFWYCAEKTKKTIGSDETVTTLTALQKH